MADAGEFFVAWCFAFLFYALVNTAYLSIPYIQRRYTEVVTAVRNGSEEDAVPGQQRGVGILLVWTQLSFGIAYFVVANSGRDAGTLVGLAVLWGVLPHGVYNATQMATFDAWPASVALLDTLSGALHSLSVSALTAVVTWAIL